MKTVMVELTYQVAVDVADDASYAEAVEIVDEAVQSMDCGRHSAFGKAVTAAGLDAWNATEIRVMVPAHRKATMRERPPAWARAG